MAKVNSKHNLARIKSKNSLAGTNPFEELAQNEVKSVRKAKKELGVLVYNRLRRDEIKKLLNFCCEKAKDETFSEKYHKNKK